MPLTFENIRELRKERAKLVKQARDVVSAADEESREVSSEEEQRFDKFMSEAEKLKTKIEREEKLLDAESDLSERSQPEAASAREERVQEPEKEDRAALYRGAFRSWLKGGMGAVPNEQRSILQDGFEQMETRALAAGTDAAGGYTVPEGFYNQLQENMLAFGGMRASGATIVPTDSGNALPIPTVDDTSNKGAILAENSQATEQDITYGQVSLPAYMYTSKIVRVSYQLLQDSAFDLENYLSGALAERLARILNEHWTVGTGSSQPQGIVTGSSQGTQGATGQTTSVTYDDLVDLEHSVDPAYRRSPAAGWMFSDSTLKVLKKIKDSDGRPIWVPGVAVREPDTILGYDYTINQDVADMSASAKSILFGDFSKYHIRDVRGVQLIRFAEKYADYLQVGFMAFARHGGVLVDAGTDPVKHYANSAS